MFPLSTWIVFSLYTLAVVGAWALFTILRIHVKGYEEYSNHITWVTRVLFWILLILTLGGYVVVFTGDFSSSQNKNSPSVHEIL